MALSNCLYCSSLLQVALARSFTFLPILFYSLTPSKMSIIVLGNYHESSYRLNKNIIYTGARSIQENTDANQCVCPGNKLIYTVRCTVQGSPTGATVWNGTAFSGCLQNEILLQHGGFTPTGGPAGICNNGAIVGQSLSVQGNNLFTSLLNVTITPETAGKTITCAYDALDGQSIMIKFSKKIPGNHSSCLHYCGITIIILLKIKIYNKVANIVGRILFFVCY